MQYLKLPAQFFYALGRRLWEQGPLTTVKWLYAVGVPLITGRMSLRYSRISDQLYIGAQVRKRGLPRLESEGIAASLNLREEFDDEVHGLSLANHLYIPIADNTALSLENLAEGVKFIRDIIERGEKVYVHCGSGVGRAPTMTAAYLISEGDSVEQAVQRVTKARPFIRILPAQMERLQEYAKNLERQPAD
jgi:protein-tyrosine phosphatase